MCTHKYTLRWYFFFCNSVLFFIQIQDNHKSPLSQGVIAACKLILGLEAANVQLETTINTGLWLNVCALLILHSLCKVTWTFLMVSEKRIICFPFNRVNVYKQATIFEQLMNRDFGTVFMHVFTLTKLWQTPMALSYKLRNDSKL